MSKVVAMKHIGYSLHGVWNKIGNFSELCMDHDTFVLEYHKKFLEGKLVHFLDASPLTEHTCCISQWHEYHKHGCLQGNSFEDWNSAVDQCLSSFDPQREYVHCCRYDKRLGCNHVDEVSSKPLEVFDCKKDKKFSSEQCVRDYTASLCYSRDGIENRNLMYSMKFRYEPKPAINPYQETPNCHCFIDPVSKHLELNDVEFVKPVYRSSVDNDIKFIKPVYKPAVTQRPEVVVTRRIPEVTTSVVLNDEELKCVCVNNTEENINITTIDIERRRKAMNWLTFKPEDTYELEEYTPEFRIWCIHLFGFIKELDTRRAPERIMTGELRNLLQQNAEKTFFVLNEFI